MRKAAACLVSVVLGASLLAPAPALAAFGVVVGLPSETAYSPYGGPATITFAFDPADPATVFTVRLRRPGHGVVKDKDYLVDPATDTSPHQVSFSWKELSASVPTDYVVDVSTQGGPVITDETFTLVPKLVTGLSAKPSPFYPLVQDGYKDTTRIGYSLSADTVDTEAHVFRANAYGRCCGNEIRVDELGPRAAGDRRWVWDGAKDDSSTAPKGTYFVRIRATDADAVSKLSKAQKVVVTKGVIRLTATKEKHGRDYARTGDFRATEIGGSCKVDRVAGSHDAFVLCANAEISVFWKWGLKNGERIESASFAIEGGYYGCRRSVGATKTESYLRVKAPPTTTCTIVEARITYSYPVNA